MQEGLHENAGLLCPQRDRQVSGCSGYKRVKALFSSFALHLLFFAEAFFHTLFISSCVFCSLRSVFSKVEHI